MKLKHTSSKVFLKLFFCILLFYAKNIYAQSEPPIDTNQIEGTYYNNDYAVDNVQVFDLINWNINTILEKDSLELGKVYEITKQFTNNISVPLVIKSVTQPCSCLEPDWYKQSIPPGGTGWIKIKYTASIPDKRNTYIKLIIYDANGVKPMIIQPVKIDVNVKYNATN